MKKFSYWILMVMFPFVCLSVSSCGDDDNENDEPQSGSKSEIVGTWEIDKITIAGVFKK